jgi:hypothetical protein
MRGTLAKSIRRTVYGNRVTNVRDYVKINQKVYTVDKINFWQTFTVLDKGCRGAYLEMKKQERGNRTWK